MYMQNALGPQNERELWDTVFYHCYCLAMRKDCLIHQNAFSLFMELSNYWLKVETEK